MRKENYILVCVCEINVILYRSHNVTSHAIAAHVTHVKLFMSINIAL